MLLKLVLSLVSFAALRFVMYSHNPDLVELRAQLYVILLERVASNKAAPAPDQTNLEKLHARVAAEANPCGQVVCPDEGPTANQIRSDLAATPDKPSNFNPKFVSVTPKN